VGGLVQAGGGLLDDQVRPQQVDQLFPVQPSSGLEREQLDDRGRASAPPRLVRDRPAVDGNREPPE
jgi:hypothetical protein